MPRTMYDSVTARNLPTAAKLVAAYVDGRYANEAAVRERCPHARVVTITVFGHSDADVIDRETGDASAYEAAVWAKGQIAKGKHPTIYCNASSWPEVKAEVQKAGIAGRVSYWIADYDNDPTIPAGAVAKQFRNSPTIDTSVVDDHWPGVDPDVLSPPTIYKVEQNRGYVTIHWKATRGATHYDVYQDGVLAAIHTAGQHTTGKLHGEHVFRVLALGPGVRAWSKPRPVTLP